MTRFRRAVSVYWHAIFAGGEVISNDHALSITVSTALSRARCAMIMEDRSGLAALTPTMAHRIGLDQTQPISRAGLRERLNSVGVTLHDPDFVYYLPDAMPQKLANDTVHACRQLTEADRPAFEAFRKGVSEQDLEDAYVELDHWVVFGAFDQCRLISVASMYHWDSAPIADLGVLTLPGFRGKGYARAVVQAISQRARDRGYEPQYRCQRENLASVALAKAAGFALFGSWEVIASDALNCELS